MYLQIINFIVYRHTNLQRTYKLLTICNNIVDIIRLVARLFQQIWYSHNITILLYTTLCGQPCNILVISRLHQTCWNNLPTSLIMPSCLLQVVKQLVTYLLQQHGASSANTTCWQLVNRFVATCLQTCDSLCVFTRVVHVFMRICVAKQVFTNVHSVFVLWLYHGTIHWWCWLGRWRLFWLLEILLC